MRFMLLVTFFALWALPASADLDLAAGNYWLEVCGPPGQADIKIDYFVLGVVTGTALAQSPPPWCPPPQVTTDQVSRVFCKYLHDHPAETHKAITYLLNTSLGSAFPCPSKH